MLKDILDNWRRSERGPLPKVDLEDLAIALIIIARGGIVGRYKLSRFMGIPQGTIRGVMKRFSENELIKVYVKGCEITSKGREALKEYFSEIGLEDLKVYGRDLFKFLAPGEVKVVAIVRNNLNKILDGLKQREEAVKAGADGATTIIVKSGEIIIPGLSGFTENSYLNDIRDLKNIVEFEGKYVIVLCWASNEAKAIKGALKAIRTIVD
ncbi:MAG: DUF4443 domain-containing protein [Candidatus Methanomethylicia archaeon]|nr:DUF4443 domain-containing protein [Candidatus Methanomethylicia archaeon]